VAAVIAVFDFDGTLVSTSVWPTLVRAQWRRRLNRLPLVLHLMAHYPLYPAVRIGILPEERFRRLWAEHMPWLLWRMAVPQAEQLFGEVARELFDALRPGVAERLRWHQSQGHLVVLLSAAFEPLLRAFAALLGLEHVVGSPLEVRDGRYTGRVSPPICMGENKVRRLQQYLGHLGISVDWGQSYAYADSYTDEAVLRLVGHPIAVCPDQRLAEVARISGWTIMQ
jgi:HAD superfamily hydrolase (TIGR01490 family)